MATEFTSKKQLLDYLIANQHNSGKDLDIASIRTYHYDIWEYMEYCKEYERDTKDNGSIGYTLAEGYLKTLAMDLDYKISTFSKKIQAVKFYLHLTGQENIFDDKKVKARISQIKRIKPYEQKQAPIFTPNELKVALEKFDERTLEGLRNINLFLVAFFGAFRRSELLELRRNDIVHHEKGLLIKLGKTKNNKFDKPQNKMLFHIVDSQYCPVNWLLKLMKLLPDKPGQPLFTRIENGGFASKPLSFGAWDNLIKKAFTDEFSSHSFRASFITLARVKKIPDLFITQQTLHKDTKSLDTYTRFNGVYENNASEYIGNEEFS